jgi:hypothetical protein
MLTYEVYLIFIMECDFLCAYLEGFFPFLNTHFDVHSVTCKVLCNDREKEHSLLGNDW